MLSSIKKLGHAYLFFGSPERDYFVSFANLLENSKEQLPDRPLIDFSIISPDDLSEGGSRMGIESIREAIKFLWQAPFRSPKKILLIEKAEMLTPEAQNAVLKIAEEPPSRSLIILSVKDPDLLLPALTSRFQKIYVPSQKKIQSDKKAVTFLKSDKVRQGAILKEVAADGAKLPLFVAGLMKELDADPVKNFTSLKALSYCWTQISRFNTNKKLQLEAWLQSHNG